MNIQEKLLSLGVSEKEIVSNLRGAYNTSFFHIYTAGDFNTDLSLISQEDRGTFIHEYIHYWQKHRYFVGDYLPVFYAMNDVETERGNSRP